MKKVKLTVNEYDKKKINSICHKFNITPVSAKILLNRNLDTVEKINEFLNPDFCCFEDATNYKDLQKGSLRLLKAVNEKEKILVYGDYDVDGVTSISQFVILLKAAGADVSYYVPEREDEGYGISSEFVRKTEKEELVYDLLVTVDCGIGEIEKIKKINELNKDVIILDHHQCGDTIPSAYAVINSKQKDCPSKNKQLCAAGLSFKFLKYLNRTLNIKDIEEKLLELACLGTIADIVELMGDNRIITYYGLPLINKTSIKGLKKLIEVAGIADKEIESYHIGYILAPRINAAGRMSSATKAVKLLLTEDDDEAEQLAQELENLNELRKSTEQKIFCEAVEKIDSELLYKKNIIVVSGTNWHEGVLGIVASKLTEKYEKPSVVISIKDKIGKGSARSLECLDIYEAFKAMDEYLIKYGGHKLAAGLTIYEEKINQFANEINDYIGQISCTENNYKEINVDAVIDINDINYKFYDEIKMFEPFGHGNQKPVFSIKNVFIKDLRRVGKNKNHLSFKLTGEKNEIPVIGFGKISMLEKILLKPSSYVVALNENEYNGRKSLQLVLLNVEECQDFDYVIDESKNKIINYLINKSKSKIVKTDLFLFVEKLNKLYNTKTTADEIICILEKNGNIQYVLKNDILYIKR